MVDVCLVELKCLRLSNVCIDVTKFIPVGLRGERVRPMHGRFINPKREVVQPLSSSAPEPTPHETLALRRDLETVKIYSPCAAT